MPYRSILWTPCLKFGANRRNPSSKKCYADTRRSGNANEKLHAAQAWTARQYADTSKRRGNASYRAT
jgi:hypothetical protein